MSRKYSNSQINKAGKILKQRDRYEEEDIVFAETALTYWRYIHAPLINTFQATLRQRITRNFKKKGFVAQRLKRSESIVGKLIRLKNMKLSTMQDIAGVRAVLNELNHVNDLYEALKNSKSKHNLIFHQDYISNPKISGYRSIHLIFEYINEALPECSNLKIEVQLRSKLQHIWATSVETMGTFLQTSLKSSEGPKDILDFFALVSSGFAHLENATPLKIHEDIPKDDLFEEVINQYDKLNIKDKLNAFRIAAQHIHSKGTSSKYHLLFLDLDKKIVNITPYYKSELERANIDYTKTEKNIIENQINAQVVLVSLVSLESLKSLKKAYPNYFLDTNDFNKKIEEIRRTTTHQFRKVKLKTRRKI